MDDYIMPEETVETAPPQAEEPEQTDVAVEDTKPTETAEPEVQTPKIKYKFNHEEKEMDHEEAVPWIQKGLNYDKLQEKIKAFEADPRLSKYDRVKQLADSYGMNDDELLDALYNQYYESAATSKGLTPEQVKMDHELKQREQTISKRDQETQTKQQSEQMYNKFVQAFPDAKPETIKPETWAKVNAGMDLTTAYVEQRNTELEAQVKALRQNEENAKKAPIRSVTAHGSKEVAEEDPFLRGFNSVK